MIRACVIAILLLCATTLPARAQSKVYSFTQPVTVGNFEYKVVKGIYRGQALKSNNPFEADRSTTGKYIEVRFTARNIGSDSNTFGHTGGVTDSAGRRFDEISGDGYFVDKQYWCSSLDPIQSTLARTCSVIFEVAADSKGFTIIFVDQELFGTEEARVWLGG